MAKSGWGTVFMETDRSHHSILTRRGHLQRVGVGNIARTIVVLTELLFCPVQLGRRHRGGQRRNHPSYQLTEQVSLGGGMNLKLTFLVNYQEFRG